MKHCSVRSVTASSYCRLLSLYVDDGMCATNDEAFYKQFITALQLSDHGDLDWHLGMKFTHNKKSGSIEGLH